MSCWYWVGGGGVGNFYQIGGVLFALEDLNRKGLGQSRNSVSCTSKFSAWNFQVLQPKI